MIAKACGVLETLVPSHEVELKAQDRDTRDTVFLRRNENIPLPGIGGEPLSGHLKVPGPMIFEHHPLGAFETVNGVSGHADGAGAILPPGSPYRLDMMPPMNPPTDSPGVRFPPPLLYAFAVILGVLLNRRVPLPVPASPWTMALALLCIAGWVMLAGPSIARFRRFNTSIVPIRPATALVTTGLYRYTRNPMYVSLALLTIGCGLLLRTWWPIVLLVPTLVAVQLFVILPEERYLHRRFGSDYDLYVRQVRRWL